MIPTLQGAVRRAIRLGLIGGAIVVYFAAIGVIHSFEPRQVITGYVSLGMLVPAITIAFFGFWMARPWRIGMEALTPQMGITAAVVGGAIAGVVVGLFILFVANVDVRWIFPNLTPRLVEIMTFGNDPTVMAILYVPGLAVISGLGGAARFLPRLAFRVVVGSLLIVLTVALVEPMLRVVLLQLANTFGMPIFRDLAGALYQSGGLTVPGAIATFLIAASLIAVRETRGPAVAARYRAMPDRSRLGLQISGIVLLAGLLLVFPLFIGSALSEVTVRVGLFALMGLGLNIVVGYAGLLDLGYVAFWAVGAYTMALLTSPLSSLGIGMNFWVALPIVMIVGALFGIMIGAPVLRLRGDYLAIVTLGFGEIVRLLLLSDALRPWLGGAQGILSIPPPGLGITREPQSLYYPVIAACAIGAFVAWSLARGRVGRAWNAMREDEDVAEATGINTTRYKLLAFSIGAVFGVVAGSFLAARLGSVFPHELNLLVSITTLALIILGGMGSIPGVIVGAIVLVGLPELFREFAEYRLLLYGAVLVGMMILRPEGLIPNKTRRRELHEVDESLAGVVAASGEAPPPPGQAATEGGAR